MEHLNPQIRDIYAHIGLAISLAQTIECQMAVVLTCASESLQKPEDYDDELAMRSKRPLGMLLAELRGVASLPQGTIERLESFTFERNDVAHRYVNDRCSELQSADGRRKMIEELDRVTERFDNLQEFFVQLMARWHQYAALNRETLADCIHQYEASQSVTVDG